jgi:hypothetical protein
MYTSWDFEPERVETLSLSLFRLFREHNVLTKRSLVPANLDQPFAKRGVAREGYGDAVPPAAHCKQQDGKSTYKNNMDMVLKI